MSQSGLNITINSDGSLTLNGERIKIPSIHLRQKIDTGANALVFLGENIFLDRQTAVKLWLAIQVNDRRDKVLQGIKEAKKVSSLDDPRIIRIYDAGVVSTFFYMIMEYYPSITLKTWLESQNRPFELRFHLAHNIFDVIHRADSEFLFHGDLHTRNILIHLDEIHRIYSRRGYDYGSSNVAMDFKVIDFGTSHFSNSGLSLSRHWRVLEKTIDSLLCPLRMRPLWYHVRPRDDKDPFMMDLWFRDYLYNLPMMLEIGFMGRGRDIRILKKRPEKNQVSSLWKVKLTSEGLAFLQSLKETDVLALEEIRTTIESGMYLEMLQRQRP